jgi:hypothetical protein
MGRNAFWDARTLSKYSKGAGQAVLSPLRDPQEMGAIKTGAKKCIIKRRRWPLGVLYDLWCASTANPIQTNEMKRVHHAN